MTTEVQYEIEDALHALDVNQLIRLFRGYGHLDGGPVEVVDDRTIRAPTPWSVTINGDVVDLDEGTNEVELTLLADERPRWDLVYIDSDGALDVVEGDPATLVGEPGRKARNPAPPKLAPADGTAIAVVYRKASENTLSSEFVYDRRMSSEVIANALDVKTASVAEAPASDADVVRKTEADALDEAKVDLPVETDDMADGAVVTAKIAEAAVGLSELKEALGTEENNPLTGETFVEDITAAERLGIPVVSDDENAPNGSLFFNSDDGSQKYKTDSGVINTSESRSDTEIKQVAGIYAEGLFPELMG